MALYHTAIESAPRMDITKLSIERESLPMLISALSLREVSFLCLTKLMAAGISPESGKLDQQHTLIGWDISPLNPPPVLHSQ